MAGAIPPRPTHVGRGFLAHKNMKIQIAAIMAVVLGLVTVIGNAAISAYAEHTISYEIKDEIGVSDNTVTTEYGTDDYVYIPEDAINVEESSIEDEDINALGTYSLASYVNALHYWDDKTYGVDYLEFAIPDAGRWRFDQTFARGELFQAFYEARNNSANWKYCTNNRGEAIIWTNSEYVPVPFEYDYELERCAMQRAVEAAMTNNHDRLDFMDADEVFIDFDSLYQYCANTNELLTCGLPDHGKLGDDGRPYQSPYAEGTAAHILEGLMEDYCNNVRSYADQGHRRAIIGVGANARMCRIGIGVIRIDAVMSGDQVRIPAHTIVEVLMSDGMWEYDKLEANGLSEDDVTVIEEDGHGGLMPHYDTPTPVVDTYMPVTIRIKDSMPGGLFDDERNMSYGGIWMNIGETYNLTDKWFGDGGAAIPLVKGMGYNPRFYSTNESVAVVENGIVKAVGSGRCEIRSDARSEKTAEEGWLDARDFEVTVREPAPAATDQSETTTPSTGGSGSTSEISPTITPPAPIVNPTGGSDTGSTVVGGKKAAQTIKLKKTSYTYKYKKLKKSSKKFSIKPVVNGGKAHGKVTYKVTKYPKGGKKYIKVNKKGIVTLKKKAKKGTYKVKVIAAETAFFKSSSKTVTIRVK